MAKTRTMPWDPVDRLTTPQYIVGYLEVVIEGDENDSQSLFDVALQDAVRAVKRYDIALEALVKALERAVIERGFRREHADRVIETCQKFSRTPRSLRY